MLHHLSAVTLTPAIMFKALFLVSLACATVSVQGDEKDDAVAYIQTLSDGFKNRTDTVASSLEDARAAVGAAFTAQEGAAREAVARAVDAAFQADLKLQCDRAAFQQLHAISQSAGALYDACANITGVNEDLDNYIDGLDDSIQASMNLICSDMSDVINCNQTNADELSACIMDGTLEFVASLNEETSKLSLDKVKLQNYQDSIVSDLTDCVQVVNDLVAKDIAAINQKFCSSQ